MLNNKIISNLQLEQEKLDKLIQDNFCKRNDVDTYNQEEGIFRTKIALFVELGELANELKTFKH
jgi:dimeric dUTPase (all-alpha-NTP-PPase superfamily)